ncbi:Cytidine deaminase [Grifola frondosa]|uniref:Cytidine deaminase n=1 Tax=Grifola frondosa TaxID=5627 RepID=A0A1C7MAX8_GRIFR|nr:Cytidine deaminase [Grifola frondosa]
MSATVDKEELIKAAFEAKENAYSKYSKFRASVDNASYGETMCAERTAIVKAVSDGVRSFAAIAIVTDVSVAISPCGLCRQVLREFCAADMPVLLVPANYTKQRVDGDSSGGVKEISLGDLLPYSFDT